MKLLSRIVTSQVNIIVQPLSAEACDFPAAMAAEAQALANREQKPVVLLGAREDRHEFTPSDHPIACEHCRKAKICNACLGPLGSMESGRCTQGRCASCHRVVCARQKSHEGT